MKTPHTLEQQLQELADLMPDAETTSSAVANARQAVLATGGPATVSRATVFAGFPFRLAALRVAASLLVVGAVVGLVVSGLSPTIAFADVLDETAHVKTVQYTETRTGKANGNRLNMPTEIVKYTILGRSKQRQEVVAVIPGDPLPEGTSWAQPAVGIVTISDLARGEIVSLDTHRKTFREVKGFLSLKEDGTISKHQVKAAPEVDFYSRMREFPADDAERLPAKEIAGKKAVGFRMAETFETQGGVDSWTRTYWVDAATKLPVQVEVSYKSTNPGAAASKWVLSDIVFDEPIDESLLSIERPAGYTVSK